MMLNVAKTLNPGKVYRSSVHIAHAHNVLGAWADCGHCLAQEDLSGVMGEERRWQSGRGDTGPGTG